MVLKHLMVILVLQTFWEIKSDAIGHMEQRSMGVSECLSLTGVMGNDFFYS